MELINLLKFQYYDIIFCFDWSPFFYRQQIPCIEDIFWHERNIDDKQWYDHKEETRRLDFDLSTPYIPLNIFHQLDWSPFHLPGLSFAFDY